MALAIPKAVRLPTLIVVVHSLDESTDQLPFPFLLLTAIGETLVYLSDLSGT